MATENKENGQERHYSFFCNRECEYFPCHETDDPDNFNCLFCYCPLYPLGRDCGGRFFYNEKGNKVCKNCNIPHIRGNYDYIKSRYREVMDRIAALERADHGTADLKDAEKTDDETGT